MKQLFVKTTLLAGLSVISLCPIFADNPSDGKPGETSQNSLQDPQKAVEYFDSELDYKTNAYFISRAIKEKMPNINIVDVRSAEAFNKGHIPGAINIPNEKYDGFDGSETDIPGLRKDAYNCVYCYTLTCNLAQKAAKKFASLGYAVKEIVGGYAGWVDGKYPIEKITAK